MAVRRTAIPSSQVRPSGRESSTDCVMLVEDVRVQLDPEPVRRSAVTSQECRGLAGGAVGAGLAGDDLPCPVGGPPERACRLQARDARKMRR